MREMVLLVTREFFYQGARRAAGDRLVVSALEASILRAGKPGSAVRFADVAAEPSPDPVREAGDKRRRTKRRDLEPEA